MDWWALGILTYEMLVGYPPFFDESPFRIYEKILEGKVQFPKWVDGRAKDLIKGVRTYQNVFFQPFFFSGLLTTDHTKRLGTLKRGVTDIKKHKWFYGVDWVCVLVIQLHQRSYFAVFGAGSVGKKASFSVGQKNTPVVLLQKRTRWRILVKLFF